MSCRWKYFVLSQKSPLLIYDHCHLFCHHASQWKTWLPLLNDLIFSLNPESFHTGQVLQNLRHLSDLCWTFSSLSINFLGKEDRWNLIGAMLKEITIFLDSPATECEITLGEWSSIDFLITTMLVEHFHSINMVWSMLYKCVIQMIIRCSMTVLYDSFLGAALAFGNSWCQLGHQQCLGNQLPVNLPPHATAGGSQGFGTQKCSWYSLRTVLG